MQLKLGNEIEIPFKNSLLLPKGNVNVTLNIQVSLNML